jgi:hypothetical protein
MIFHVSIPADRPAHVADVLAELWKGEAFRFPPIPGAYVAMAGDERGSTIEVYPRAMVIAPGESDDMCKPQLSMSRESLSCFHLAVATQLSADEIIAIGEREGWRAVRCNRGGFFDVIELWVENCVLIEVMTEEMQRDYQSRVNFDTWRWTRQQATPR